MESVSDIDLLQDRPLFKLGLIAHDYRKTVIASVLIVCFSLGSLTVLLTPDWVESFGEGDMESVDAFGILGESFGEADAENTESFYILVLHEISYDDQGNITGGSFMEYLVPTAVETPHWETDKTVTPSPHHPLGAKGVGESPTVGAPPAIVNAVVDALSHLGVRHIDIPVTPEKVWRAMQKTEAA